MKRLEKPQEQSTRELLVFRMIGKMEPANMRASHFKEKQHIKYVKKVGAYVENREKNSSFVKTQNM